MYADWLLQQPGEAERARGEYIALACSTARNPRRTGRIKELHDKYRAAWLGPIAKLCDRESWSRGFVDGLVLTRHQYPTTGDIEAALDHPLWRTLRVFDTAVSTIPLDDIRRLICQPACANLKGLYVSQLLIESIDQSASAPRITEVAIAPWSGRLESVFPLLSAGFLSRMRRLHLFGLSPAHLPQLVLPEVTLIAVAAPGSLVAWVQELERLRVPLAELRIVSSVYPLLDRRGIELIVRPDDDGHWSTLEVRWTHHSESRLRDGVIHHLQIAPENLFSRASFVGPTAARFDVARWKHRITRALQARNAGIVIDRG